MGPENPSREADAWIPSNPVVTWTSSRRRTP